MLPRAIVLALLLPSAALAVPVQLNHQGRLLDTAGTPLSGAHTLDFAFYEADAGGVPRPGLLAAPRL